MKYISIYLFLINITIFAQNTEKDSLEYYSFTDFNGKQYKVADFKDKYILVTQITDDADTAMVRRYLQHYEKIAKSKTHWIFINVIWSNYDINKSFSIDKFRIKWTQTIKNFNLKEKNVICLYEDKNKGMQGFSKLRLIEYIVQYCSYIDKNGKQIVNTMNDWKKDVSPENIQEFKNIFDFFENLFRKMKYKPRR